jgi:type IV pilus assembly protein PilA
MRKIEGFTLIELMIVVAILGFLMAVAMPVYHTYTIRARMANVLVEMARDKSWLNEFIADNGRVPVDQPESELRVQSKYIGAVEYFVTDPEPGQIGNNCYILYTLGEEMKDPLIGRQIAIRPILDYRTKEVKEWECYSEALPFGIAHLYLPERCRN